MIWGMGLPTRRGILDGFICAGAIAAVSGFRPVRALAVTLPSAWTGFATAPCWQSFTLVTGDTIVLPVKVASAEVEAIIDSGSAASILSPPLAAKLGILQAEQRTIRGIGGRANAHLAHDVEISLAGVVSRLPTVVIADLTAVSLALGRPVDVVLGEDILAERCIALDFGNGRISVSKGNTFAGGRGWKRISVFHGSNRELLLDASVAGMPTAPMVFDLGNSTALMLSPQYVDDHQLLRGVRKSSAAIGGVDGVRIATAFMSETVELGGFLVRSVPTLTPSAWASNSAIGNIGLPLIAQFDVVLDVSAGNIWLRPVLRGLTMLEDHSGFGLALTEGELLIVHVALTSPAAKDGWSVGDRIQAIDGRSIDSSYILDEHWRWRFRPPGTRVALRDQAGRVRDLTLADYF